MYQPFFIVACEGEEEGRRFLELPKNKMTFPNAQLLNQAVHSPCERIQGHALAFLYPASPCHGRACTDSICPACVLPLPRNPQLPSH
jgi:hypothetical protein